MRTTLNLPDDVYQAARALSVYEEVSLGEALAKLVRQGMDPGAKVQIDLSGAFPKFVSPPGTPAITLEKTLELEDEW